MFRTARNHPKKYHLCQKPDKSGIWKCVLAAPSRGLLWKLWLSPKWIRTKMNDGDNVNDDDDRDDIISLLACCKINSVWAFTFTFQNYFKLWKQLLLSLVIPQLCWRTLEGAVCHIRCKRLQHCNDSDSWQRNMLDYVVQPCLNWMIQIINRWQNFTPNILSNIVIHIEPLQKSKVLPILY